MAFLVDVTPVWMFLMLVHSVGADFFERGSCSTGVDIQEACFLAMR
jgi:hypothetical protein